MWMALASFYRALNRAFYEGVKEIFVFLRRVIVYINGAFLMTF